MIWLVLSIIILLLIYHSKTKLHTQLLTFLVIKRGILTPNCKWWKISDFLLKDNAGVELYQKLQSVGKLVPIRMFTTKMYLVTSLDYVKTILSNSPTIFGVGKLKYDFFKSFMPLNVGVSEGCPWKGRRVVNESVLDSVNKTEINNWIQHQLSQTIPTTFQEATTLGKKAIGFIVFRDNIPDKVFDMFTEANSITSVSMGGTSINSNTKKAYFEYLDKAIENPIPGSLVYSAMRHDISKKILIDQIPHWMFPVGGIFNSNAPRLLVTLYNNPRSMKLVREELNRVDPDNIEGLTYLRKCILEVLRLNNPVISMFRTLLVPFWFGEINHPKGTQFVILTNPILRDPEYWNDPDEFIPERWTKDKELSYCSIMFSQGPQECPGKELAVYLMQSYVSNWLRTVTDMNVEYPPITNRYLINPCTINFKIN